MEKTRINPQTPLAVLTPPPLQSQAWAEFVQAALLADHACYQQSADRVDPARLSSVISAFPQGFRVYLAEGSPVGYTGWYPVEKDVFNVLHDTPEKITHRGFMKPVPLAPEGNWIYLFNYSIIPSLASTAQSRALIKNYAAELKNIDIKGLAAVTVTADGIRIAKKFGLCHRGTMTHDGETEQVYALRL